jgi:hypothetical protein
MIKVKITKLSDTSIRIERFENGIRVRRKTCPAQFYATENENSDTLTIKTDRESGFFIIAAPQQLEINGAIPASVEEAVTLLNAFIGNFSAAGGSALTTLKEMEDALTWN